MNLSRYPTFFAISMCALLFCHLGCTTNSATVTVQQEHAPPSQKKMTLKSDWAFTARQDDRRLCLADFTLPGAVDGPRDFRVFVILPGSADSAEIGHGESAARGFFLQKVGRLRGKTEFTSGSVQLSTSRLNPRQRQLRLVDVQCADGTRLDGIAGLRESEDELRVFLLQHAGDVAALDSGAPGRTLKRGEEDANHREPDQSKAATAGEEVAENADHQPSAATPAENP